MIKLSHTVIKVMPNVCLCVCVCDGIALTGLLVLFGLQASGRSESFSGAGGWSAEEAATRTSHKRQATYLRPLYQLLQVRAVAEFIIIYCDLYIIIIF